MNDSTYAQRLAVVAAEIVGVSPDDVMGSVRTFQVVDARGAVMYALKQKGWNNARIGRVMNRNHATVFQRLQSMIQRARTEADTRYLLDATVAASQAPDPREGPEQWLRVNIQDLDSLAAQIADVKRQLEVRLDALERASELAVSPVIVRNHTWQATGT